MRKFFAVLAFVGLASVAHAQPSLTIAWDYADSVATPTVAQGYIYRYVLDGGSPVIIQAVVCGVNGNLTTCAAPFPIPSIGTHTIYVTAQNEYGVSDPSPTITFKYPAIPPAPQNLRILKGE